jgi:thiol:disulfide interchange protein DsbA
MRTRNLTFSLAFSFILSTFLLIANLAIATPTEPDNNAEYITLKTPQPVPEGKKIEVLEFFMYHCPACNTLDPALNTWVKKQGDNIIFKRIHVPQKNSKNPEAHLFLTLEAMQKAGDIQNFDELHKKIFKTWHVDHIQLLSDEKNIEWAEKNGIDKDKFKSFYDSPAVLKELTMNSDKVTGIAAQYQVDSTPTIVVDGRYQTNMARVEENNTDLKRDKLPEATLQVVDALIVKARASKK